jgi:transposase-like protein
MPQRSGLFLWVIMKKYNAKMGPKLTALMAEGYTLSAAAASLGVSPRTVYDWRDKYPEFREQMEIAQGLRLHFLEERLLDPEMAHKTTATIFALKNCAPHGPDAWRESAHVEHTGKVGTDFALPDDRQLARIILAVIGRANISLEAEEQKVLEHDDHQTTAV